VWVAVVARLVIGALASTGPGNVAARSGWTVSVRLAVLDELGNAVMDIQRLVDGQRRGGRPGAADAAPRARGTTASRSNHAAGRSTPRGCVAYLQVMIVVSRTATSAPYCGPDGRSQGNEHTH
jgi:hypothetical protein